MDREMMVLVVVLALLAVVAVVILVQRQRSESLRKRYGPEYERMTREAGSRKRAEAELDKRQRRVQQLQIRSLPPEQRDRLLDQWRSQQARFVDDPHAAVTEADRLIGEVMMARGYPVGDFEQRAADISVDHPRVVDNYRAAHEIAVRHGRGEASTEDLRQAMVYYRVLFEELLEDREAVSREAGR